MKVENFFFFQHGRFEIACKHESFFLFASHRLQIDFFNVIRWQYVNYAENISDKLHSLVIRTSMLQKIVHIEMNHRGFAKFIPRGFFFQAKNRKFRDYRKAKRKRYTLTLTCSLHVLQNKKKTSSRSSRKWVVDDVSRRDRVKNTTLWRKLFNFGPYTTYTLVLISVLSSIITYHTLIGPP